MGSYHLETGNCHEIDIRIVVDTQTVVDIQIVADIRNPDCFVVVGTTLLSWNHHQIVMQLHLGLLEFSVVSHVAQNKNIRPPIRPPPRAPAKAFE